MENKSLLKTFTTGIVRENPTLRLVLGTCPTLAITTMAENGLWMGMAATFVLLGSNVVISLTRKIIPDKVRIPAFITIIAGFVTLIQMLVRAYLPEVNDKLGIYLPLIVVNCLILARAEMFASKNKVLPSVLDALGMGIGFTAALVAMGSIRELLGSGTLFGLEITRPFIDPMIVMILPAGGFFVFAVLIVLANKLAGEGREARLGCAGCPNEAMCSRSCAEHRSECAKAEGGEG